MREKLARAIWERRREFAKGSGISLEPFDTLWDGVPIAEANDVYGEVDAVLDALTEPTEVMIEEGRWPAEDDGPLACFRAMVLAAKEGK